MSGSSAAQYSKGCTIYPSRKPSKCPCIPFAAASQIIQTPIITNVSAANLTRRITTHTPVLKHTQSRSVFLHYVKLKTRSDYGLVKIVHYTNLHPTTSAARPFFPSHRCAAVACPYRSKKCSDIQDERNRQNMM